MNTPKTDRNAVLIYKHIQEIMDKALQIVHTAPIVTKEL
jgi:hypothetical protein